MITPPPLTQLFKTLTSIGAKPIIVGGFVRDKLLGLNSKDIDIEVFGIASLSELVPSLETLGKVSEVGKQFQVLKLRLFEAPELDLDIALPRREVKIGDGHRGFETTPAPDASFKEAASRRDFTINAIGYDPETQRIEDPYGGQADLQAGLLRHVGPAFVEDPLRVLRAMQFAARFNLEIAPETLALCAQMPLTELPKERLFEEIKKLLLKSASPSQGLALMAPLGILTLFPELAALKGVPQNPVYHPEGDVWTHTLMVVDCMAKSSAHLPEDKRLILMVAALCHDFGKALCTRQIDGVWRSFGHEPKGVEPTQAFLWRITEEKAFINEVCKFVREHGQPLILYLNSQKQKVRNGAIRRLALKINMQDLLLLAQADSNGRTTEDAKTGKAPHVDWLRERAKELDVLSNTPTPILTGKILLDHGFKPGPTLGKTLDRAFNAQLEDAFDNVISGLAWLGINP